MSFNYEGPSRRSIRLRGYDYGSPGLYFITICAEDRKLLFGDIIRRQMRCNETGEMIQQTWCELPRNYPGVGIDQFVVMPNHVHGIIVLQKFPRIPGRPRGAAPTMALPEVMHRYKSLTSARYRKALARKDALSFSGRLWQRNYYDHIIRDGALDRIRR